MNIKTYWEPDIPDDVRMIVEPHLVRWFTLIPTWCQNFVVRFDPTHDGQMAAKVNYRNRWAVLVVTGQWLALPKVDRDNALVHELVHIIEEPLCSAVGRIIEDVIPKDTPLYALADSVFSDGLEATTEDMARCIGRLREQIEP